MKPGGDNNTDARRHSSPKAEITTPGGTDETDDGSHDRRSLELSLRLNFFLNLLVDKNAERLTPGDEKTPPVRTDVRHDPP